MGASVIAILVIAVLLIAIGGGYFLATHVHSIATSAASAITRATTVPASDVATLNAKVDGLGSTLNNLTTAVGTITNTGVTAAVAAAPKPEAPAS